MQITIEQAFADHIANLNAYRTFYQKKNGEVIQGAVASKPFSVQEAPGITRGFNVGDTVECGTMSEVKAGTKDITTDLGDSLIAKGYAAAV